MIFAMPLQALAAYLTCYCDTEGERESVSFGSLQSFRSESGSFGSKSNNDRKAKKSGSIVGSINPPACIIICRMEEVDNNQEGQPAGRRSGDPNCTREECLYFLGVMEEVLPIGSDEWQVVVDQHNAVNPGRSVTSMRRKYANLHRKQIPTGDPDMPPEVRAAKRVKHKIGARADIGDGEDEHNLEQGNFNQRAPPVPPVDNNDDEDAPEVPEVPPPPVAAAASAASASEPTSVSIGSVNSASKRSCNKSSHDQFLHVCRMSLLKENKKHRQLRGRKGPKVVECLCKD